MRRVTRLTSLALGALVQGGCEFGTVAIERPAPQVVVHAVLDPRRTEQFIVVERTLTGRVNVVSGGGGGEITGGEPVVGATVRVTEADGTFWLATSGGELPAGHYRIFTQQPGLVMGARYRLEVRTREGEVVTGETTIPVSDASPTERRRSFNRDHDTLSLAWPAARLARTYALSINSPLGAFTGFLDDTTLRIPGTLRNLGAGGLPRVFLPGFRHTVLVAAVDANYFDYYRSRSDPFTGAGLISHLRGGVGLFGAVVTLHSEEVATVADMDEPGEGVYRRIGVFRPDTLRLWVETPASGERPAVLTGNYYESESLRTTPLVGVLSGAQFTLALLRRESLRDTAAVIVGELRGDTLVGHYRGTSVSVLFVRRR